MITLVGGNSAQQLLSTTLGRRSKQRELTVEIDCAKKRGKKRQKGKNAERAGPRLTPDSVRELGGLKNAIRLVRRHNAEESKEERTRTEVRRNRYRKKKKTPEELAAAREEIPNATLEYSDDLDESDDDENPPILVIDAYNVIGEMIRQDRERFRDKILRAQRQILEEDVAMHCGYCGFHACIVYDALGNRNPDPSTLRTTSLDVETVYCTEYEADRGLLVESERYIAHGATNIIVVSSDIAACNSCERPPIITCKSSRTFVKDIANSRQDLQTLLDEQNNTVHLTSLGTTLSRETLLELDEIRRKLRSNSLE